MPLPHFLLLIIAILFAAMLTLWVFFAAGIPEVAVALIVLTGAALLHLGHRSGHDHEG